MDQNGQREESWHGEYTQFVSCSWYHVLQTGKTQYSYALYVRICLLTMSLLCTAAVGTFAIPVSCHHQDAVAVRLRQISLGTECSLACV